ncbi:MAG TPA: hypothetical protein VGO52_02730 [Hyphomonadaceae bacterium]|jgi:hypothetical protein|nr:hypothetical protein [Hyphomonadaceae bacterium]
MAKAKTPGKSVNTKPPAKKAPPKPPAKAPSAKAAPKPSAGGTKDKPWKLSTPSGGSTFEAWRDETAAPPALVCNVGSTVLSYQLRCIEDLHAMLKKRSDWMALGGADEQKPATEGSVEAWARSPANPVKGWYGLKKGFRGRFGHYVPPVMEFLGLAEVEHNPKNNRMRAK